MHAVLLDFNGTMFFDTRFHMEAWSEIYHELELYRRMCRRNPDSLHLVAGAEKLMQGLHERGIPFILASASIKANVDFYFDSFPIGKWLKKEDVVYDDGTYANKGEMHLEAARRLNVPFAECMVIEDSVAAITLAKRNGVGQIVAIGEKADGSDLIHPRLYRI